MIGDDDLPLPSGNAPADLHNAGNVGRIWTKIDGLGKDVSEIKTDIALIKQALQIQKDDRDRKKSFQNAAGVAAISGVISFVVSHFR